MIKRQIEHWQKFTLKEITLDMIQGVNTAIDTPEYVKKGIPLLKANNIIDMEVSLDTSEHISPNTFNGYSDRFKIKINDFLFSNIGARLGTGSLMRRTMDCSFAWNVMRIIPNQKIVTPAYFAYLMNSPILFKSLKKNESGSGMGFVSKTILSNLHVSLPLSLPEQDAIVNILDCWSNMIGKYTNLITQKELRKKALMQQLFTGKKRLKGFKGKWELIRLDEFFSERNEIGEVDLPLLSITADRGVIYQSESEKKDSSNEDKSKYKRICKGDIGYNTMRMWQGRNAMSNLEGIVSPAYTIVKPKKNADALFFSYLFKFSPVVHKFFRNSQGLVDDTLNCKFHDFAKVRITLPLDKGEQRAIAAVLKTADEEIGLLNNKLERLREQKKGLMQILLTGKKRLKTR